MLKYYTAASNAAAILAASTRRKAGTGKSCTNVNDGSPIDRATAAGLKVVR